MSKMASNLKLFRQDKNWTQQQLADKLFVTRQAVSNWENGKTEPDADMLIKLAGVLEVDINDILQGKTADIVPQKEKKTYDKTLILYAVLMLVSFAVRIAMMNINRTMSYSDVISDTMRVIRDLCWKTGEYLLPVYAVSIGLTEFSAAALITRLIKNRFAINNKTMRKIFSVVHIIILFFIVLHFTTMFTGTIDAKPFIAVTSFLDSVPKPVRTVKGFLKYSALMEHRRWHFAVVGGVFELTNIRHHKHTD